MQEIAQPELYVLSYGDQLFLIIDCVVVTNVDVELLPLTLLSAYFSDAVLVELLFFFHSRL